MGPSYPEGDHAGKPARVPVSLSRWARSVGQLGNLIGQDGVMPVCV